MTSIRMRVWFITACLLSGILALAQVEETTAFESAQESAMPASAAATLPRLIMVRGTLHDDVGKPANGIVPVTFTLYKDQNSAEALWQEAQNVRVDATGNYGVLLGATKEEGLPLEIFASGEARWLGVQPEGQVEQPRVLLLAVAYALKAADAETLGGKPASAFALAGSQSPAMVSFASIDQSSSAGAPGATPTSVRLLSGSGPAPATSCTTITSDGTATANQVTKFSAACSVQSSGIFESGGNVGIGNTNPAGPLDVSGNAFIRGLLTSQGGAVFPPTGTATTTKGFTSDSLQSINPAPVAISIDTVLESG